MSLLLDAGADVHAQDTDRRIALDVEYASEVDQFSVEKIYSNQKKFPAEIASLLLDKADASSRLLWTVGAFANPHPTVTLSALQKLLVEEGADVNAVDPRDIKRPLHYALENGASVAVVALLLDKGALVNEQTRRTGDTPLHFAVKHTASAKVVSLLLDKGADIHAQACPHPTPHPTNRPPV